MDLFHAIVLGLVQGLTEFLPISSSGHLRIVPAFAGWDDPGAAFTAVIQIGTMLAVLLYFRRDLWSIAAGWTRGTLALAQGRRGRPHDAAARRTLEYRMGWYIVLGTIPISVFGLAFSHQIEHDARNLHLIGTTLIVFGVLLLVADRIGRQARQVEQITWRDGLLIGLAQTLALIPGVSRSGATMTAGLLLGFDRAAAARYSFLLSVPAVVLSGLFELRKIGDPVQAGEMAAGVGPTIVATLVAFVAGYASIAWMLRWLAGHTVAIFTGYRVALGAGVLALVASGAIS